MTSVLKVVDRGRNSRRIPHAVLVNRCPRCGQTSESPLFTVKKWDAWLEARKKGARVQAFWPEFTTPEREEFFLSGVCGRCWDKLFDDGEPKDEGDTP